MKSAVEIFLSTVEKVGEIYSNHDDCNLHGNKILPKYPQEESRKEKLEKYARLSSNVCYLSQLEFE